MLNKKVALPIIAAVLMALGVNLEKFGIDLEALIGTDNTRQSDTRSSGSSNSDIFNNPGNNDSGNADGSSTSANTAAYRSGAKWSDTSPEINLHHIFEGEINRKGKPVGYHSRPGGIDVSGAKIVKMRDKPNSAGVYTAIIAIRDGNQWKEKFSSFFPDNMSADEVTKAILNAYQKSSNKKKQPWRGPSGHGFNIEGYTTNRGGINTAFPIR